MTSFPFLIRMSIVLGAFALGTVAHAQETGTLIKHKAAQIDDVRTKAGARLAGEQFGACLLDRSFGRVSKWTELPVGSPDYYKMIDSLIDVEDACISNGQISFSRNVLRGAIFQSLYLRTYGKRPLPSFAPDISTKYRDLYPASATDMDVEARQILALEQFGECVSKADPETVRRLLLSTSNSSAEGEIFATLAPRFSGCIVAGENLTFSKLILKGALAEGMFRLTRAAQPITSK